MADSTAFTFRLSIAPAWENLVTLLQERAAALDIAWPAKLNPHTLPRIYSLTVAGKVGDGVQYEVVAWQPPRELAIAESLRSFAELDVSFGVAAKRAFAVHGKTPAHLEALAVRLDSEGLFFAAQPEPPLARTVVMAMPIERIVRTFRAVSQKELKLEGAGIDHIVNKYVSPAGLEDFAVSQWRGDASYRLSSKLVRLEIWLDPKVPASAPRA